MPVAVESKSYLDTTRCERPNPHRWTPLPLIFAVAVYSILALWIAHTKAPWQDEGWFANPAYNLAFHGRMGSDVLEPSGFYLNAFFRGVQDRTYYVMPTHLIALAGWFRAVGFSVMSARMYSICWGVVTLGVLFYIVRGLFPNRTVASVAVFLTAIDFIFLWTTSDARMDAPASALALCSVGAYLYFRERDLRKAVLSSQVLGACAVFTHPNAVLVILATAVLGWRFDRDRLRWGYLGMAIVPYIAFGLLWSAYILRSPGDFVHQFLPNLAGHDAERLRIFVQPHVAVWNEIIRHLIGASTPSGLWAGWMALAPMLYVPALGWFLCKHEPSMRMFWTYTVAMILGMTFLNGFKAHFYLIYVVPVYDTVLAAWLVSRRTIEGRCAAGVVVLAFVTLQVSISVLHIRADQYHREYMPTIRDLIRYRSERKTIVGTSSLGFGLSFDGFKDDMRLGTYSGLSPDVIVVDRSYRYFEEFFAKDEPRVTDHIRTMLDTRYRLKVKHGSFWIFERSPDRNRD